METRPSVSQHSCLPPHPPGSPCWLRSLEITQHTASINHPPPHPTNILQSVPSLTALLLLSCFCLPLCHTPAFNTIISLCTNANIPDTVVYTSCAQPKPHTNIFTEIPLAVSKASGPQNIQHMQPMSSCTQSHALSHSKV